MVRQKKSSRGSSPLRGLLRIAGPVVVVLGIGLVAFSAMDFASTVGTETATKLDIEKLTSRRKLRAPAYGWCRWVGITLIAAGVVVTSAGFELFAGRKKEEPEQRKARPRKSIRDPLGK